MIATIMMEASSSIIMISISSCSDVVCVVLVPVNDLVTATANTWSPGLRISSTVLVNFLTVMFVNSL